MAKKSRGYKSEKRKKEIARQKKQEEKRQRRMNKGSAGEGDEAGDMIETAVEKDDADTVEVMEDEGTGEESKDG